MDFMQRLSDEEMHFPSDNENEVYSKGVLALKRWGRMFPVGGVFSPGFLDWAQSHGFAARKADTNGCLMRQSPIALIGLRTGLSLEACLGLARIFCYSTHMSRDAFLAADLHLTLIYQALSGKLTKADLVATGQVQSLAAWHAIVQDTKGRFIWDARQSLGIAISALAASDSWEEMMQFFIAVSGDVDTYAAIAGPIAQCIYPESSHFELLEKHLDQGGEVAHQVRERYYALKLMAKAQAHSIR